MTTNTPNLSLVLYDNGTDAGLTFNAFRTDIAGSAVTSNFYKIDTAIGEDRVRISDLEITANDSALLNGQSGTYYLTDNNQVFSDITTNNSSSTKHGYLPKLSNVATEFLTGIGTWATPAGGGGGTFNFYQDSSATTALYGTLVGLLNDSNTLFTISQTSYVSGTLSVYKNGQQLTPGASNDWTETSPASGTFTLVIAPSSTDVITVSYQTTSIATGGDALLLNSQSGTYYLTESNQIFTDITTNNASSTKHGYLPKLSNVATEFLTGTGAWATPAGGASYSDWQSVSWAGLTRTGATTFTTTTDVSGIIRKGTKLKLTDSTTKSFVVYSAVFGSGVTTITLITSSLYSLIGNPSNIYYSNLDTPYGFPLDFSFTPSFFGFSVDPTVLASWQIISGGFIMIRILLSGAAGTSSGTNFVVRCPVVCRESTGGTWSVAMNNGVQLTSVGRTTITTGSTDIGLYTDMYLGSWSSTSAKYASFNLIYPI
jgi:hypothetical protein